MQGEARRALSATLIPSTSSGQGRAEAVDGGFDNSYMGYAMVDQAIRVLNHQSTIEPNDEGTPFVVMDSTNLPPPGSVWVTKSDYKAAYFKLCAHEGRGARGFESIRTGRREGEEKTWANRERKEASSRRWTRRPDHSNWGDFGENDQIGRLNLITPERRRKAAEETGGRPRLLPESAAGSSLAALCLVARG